MNAFRREQTDPRMPVFFVVPGEKGLAEVPCVLDASETFREVGPVLEGFELRLRVGIVVAGVRPTVSLGDAEVGQKQGDGFGFHGSSPVGMKSQLIPADVLAQASFPDELFRQGGRFASCKHPPDRIAAEDVKDDVKVKVGPFDGSQEFGDIP